MTEDSLKTIVVDHSTKHDLCKLIAEARTLALSLGLPRSESIEIDTRLSNVLDRVLSYDEEGECNCEPASQEPFEMDIYKAIDIIRDGHGLVSRDVAEAVCAELGVEHDPGLEQHYYSDWTNPKGLMMNQGREGALCVSTLVLSDFVARHICGPDAVPQKLGRGFQAQENAKAVVKELRKSGKLPEKEKV